MNLRLTTMHKFLLALVVVVVISVDTVTSSTLRCSDDELDEVWILDVFTPPRKDARNV